MSKGGSKIFTAIIAFILGFLFAFVAEIGAIFGVYYYAMHTDLETLMSTVGIKNTDEDGNKIYINTNKVTTVDDLVKGIQGLVYEDGSFSVALSRSFDDFADLIPATDKLLGMVYNYTDKILVLDKDEFEGTPLTELAQVLAASINNIRMANLIDTLKMDSLTNSNTIVKTLLMGAETEYATVRYGSAEAALEGEVGGETGNPEQGGDTPAKEDMSNKFPVLFDFYTNVEGSAFYTRTHSVDGTSEYPANFNEDYTWLTDGKSKKDGEINYTEYKLYYVPCKVTSEGITQAEYITGEYTMPDPANSEKQLKFPIIKYGEGTDFIAVKPDPVTGDFVIDYDAVYASLNSSATGVSDRFAGYSYFEPYASNYYYVETSGDTASLYTVCGLNYFRDQSGKIIDLDPLILSDIMEDAFRPLDSVPVTSVFGGDQEIVHKVFGKTSLGELMRGDVDFNELVNKMDVGTFIDNVSPDNKIMAYVAFKLSDLIKVDENNYTAVYDKFGEDEKPVNVKIENGYIKSVSDLNGVGIDGVKINEVAALANNMTVNVIMDIPVNDAIISYLGYGISRITEVADPVAAGYDYVGKFTVGTEKKDCYITVEKKGEDEIIESAWYMDGDQKVVIKSTKVSEVSNRFDGFSDDLAIGDILDLSTNTNKIMEAIKDKTLNEVPDAIEALTVGDIVSDTDIQNSPILRQLRYSKVSELAQEIDKTLIQSIYAHDVYGDAVAEGADPAPINEYNGEYLYFVDVNRNDPNKSPKYELVTDNVKDGMDEFQIDNARGYLTETQYNKYVSDRIQLYSYGRVQGMWRLILFTYNDADFNTTHEYATAIKHEKAYTINNFNNMIEQSKANVNNATLGELHEAGVISDVSGKTFKFLKNPDDPSQGTTEVALETLKLCDLISIITGTYTG